MIGSLFQAIGSTVEARRLKKEANAINPVRPIYEIPQGVSDVVANTQNLAQGDMPGYGRSVNQAQGNTANTLNQARNFADSGTSLLQSLSMAGESERRNMGDINMQNQGFKVGQMNNFNQALMNQVEYEDQAFQFNKADPYFQQESDKRQLTEAYRNQRNASWDAWGSFATGVQDKALTIVTGGMAGEGGVFSKMFRGKKGGESAPSKTSYAPINSSIQNQKPMSFDWINSGRK